jgi:hypothetical protein
MYNFILVHDPPKDKRRAHILKLCRDTLIEFLVVQTQAPPLLQAAYICGLYLPHREWKKLLETLRI